MDYDQTHWAPAQRRQPLPTFYYHGHFVEMLDFVSEQYAHVLLEEHVAFISDFRTLSREAQCLYVRLANRKGRLFARNKLRYPELGNLEPLLQALLSAAAARGLTEVFLHAQCSAVGFYETQGFLTVGAVYSEAGIPHQTMRRSLLP